MKRPTSHRLQQIYVPLEGTDYEPIQSYNVEKQTHLHSHDVLQAALLRFCPAEVWHGGSNRNFCPHPILVSNEHQSKLVKLHEALVLAITDIVERWWTDNTARFPQRMPLDKKEEDLLQWMDRQHPQLVPRYRDSLGSWRPDFLVEPDASSELGDPAENFRMTEINARFSFNGWMYIALGQQALKDIGIGDGGRALCGSTDPTQILGGLFQLFQPGLPLYLLKGKEAGVDIHKFVNYLQRHVGLTPRFITPADLRLIPDSQGKSGYKLCCVAKAIGKDDNTHSLVHWEGELLEEIHQVGLELHQQELLALDPEMLKQISLRCFNDMRTILLTHDKRLLGIVKEELQSLLERGVLDQSQAHALEKGIAETILPGSMKLTQLVERSRNNPEIRKDYILKPIRSGKGDGIIFGDDMSPGDWVSALERLQSQLKPEENVSVVQRRVNHWLYDVMLKEDGIKTKFPLIGTYHSIHGQYVGLGVWRSSLDRICAISHGGAWMCSVTEQK